MTIKNKSESEIKATGSAGGNKPVDIIADERENFRNLFRQTPEMVCILRGADHTFEFVNDAHVKTLGFDATGMTVRDAQPESVEVHGLLDEVFQTGVTAELNEIPVTVADRLRYFNLTYSPRRSAEGEVIGVMILGTEITDQFLTREVLKSQNLALEMTMNGRGLSEVLEILALGLETNIGRGVLTSILLLDHNQKRLINGASPSLPQQYRGALKALESRGAELFSERKVLKGISSDPTWGEFSDFAQRNGLESCWVTPLYSSSGRMIAALVLYNTPDSFPTTQEEQVVGLMTQTISLIIERDFEASEKKEAERALTESKQLYNTNKEQLEMAVDVAKVGFYEWDILTDKVTLSPQMKKDWGIREGADSLVEAVNYIHEEDRDRVRRAIEATVEKDVPYHIEYRVKQPDGGFDWVDVRGQVHRGPDGKALRFFGTSVVITEQKKREASLRQAQELAESASAAKGTFLANMSHEIRTPLGAILGFLELLKESQNSPQDLKNYIGIIERNSNHLLGIVDDILDLSKIEAGKFKIEDIRFSLALLLKDFRSLMAFKAGEKGLDFILEFHSDLPEFVVGDPNRVRQILSNVVGNAIKFTSSGKVKLILAYEKKVLNIKVEDTGCGIPDSLKSHLFKPFSQADNSTTRIFGGTGLGLSLTQRLTRAMGGQFYLQSSKVGEGSVFAIELPLKLAANTETLSQSQFHALSKQADAKEETERTSLLTDLKVLVVEDAPDNQVLIEIILRGWGAQVELASDGEEGVEKALTDAYDVILMDIQMPKMDGHEATQKLREEGFSKPIIALTAHAMKEERSRCITSGFTNFLSKPIDKKNLLVLLLKHHTPSQSFIANP